MMGNNHIVGAMEMMLIKSTAANDGGSDGKEVGLFALAASLYSDCTL